MLYNRRGEFCSECLECNEKRGNKDVKEFVFSRAEELGRCPETILLYIRSHTRMKLNKVMSQMVLDQRKMKDA